MTPCIGMRRVHLNRTLKPPYADDMRTARAIVVMCVVLAACSGPTGPGDRHGWATVTVDMMSGLPNPAWDLDAPAAAAIVAVWDTLPPTEPIAYPDVLGYRGTRVHFADEWALVVTRGVAMASDGSARRDTDGALERLIITTGRGRIDDATADLVLDAIGG